MNRPLFYVVALILGTSALEFAEVGTARASSTSAVMTAEAQTALTPAEALADLKAGNQRFVNGAPVSRDYLGQVEATATGQFPKAVVLSCLDSRVPVEIVFDQGIGDLFVGRVAGNFENVDMLGSFEFATKLAGTPLIVVLGHSSCGAVKGAVDNAKLGNLTAMLEHFDPAIESARAKVNGEMSSKNKAMVAAVVDANVRQTISDIMEQSSVIAELVASGDVAVVGGIYDLSSGEVTWID